MNPNPNRELLLQAYNGRTIPNHIDSDPADNVVELNRRAMRRRLIFPTKLGPPTGRYNCHGLVFGSRRTNIPPAGMPYEIKALLEADQFEPVQSPRVGDIIIYSFSDGRIEHSGFVSRIDSVGTENVVSVWSMWGALGEFEHTATIGPYDDLTQKYWRLRQ